MIRGAISMGWMFSSGARSRMGMLVLGACLVTASAHAQVPTDEDLPPVTPAESPSSAPSLEEPAPVPEAPASAPASQPGTDSTPPADEPFLSSLGPGTGPGVPWQVVLVAQLLAYVAADALPYIGCVAGSWLLSLLVPLGPGLLVALLLSTVLIPTAAVVSGCSSAALMGWLGDRLGVLRGRLACVGATSVLTSFITYALVIAPIIVGMGFFAVAAYSFLSASVNLVLPTFNQRALPWWLSAAGYSLTAAGLVGAVVFVAIGAVLAPFAGFVIRPALVTLVYRFTGRAREPGEEQWPPSFFGERADQLPWPWRARPAPATPAKQQPVEAAPAQ